MRYKALVAGAALVLAAPALAEDWDFVLINSSGKEIKAIELAPAGTETWQANKVDAEVPKVVKVSAKTTVHFDKTGCRYDIKATFADDSNSVWRNVNVCDNAYVTVKYRGTDPVFTAN